MEVIGQRVRREGRVAFSTFFEGESKRNVIVGLFLAILELLRHHGFRAEQAADYGEIWIRPPINDTGGPLVPSSDQEAATSVPDDRG
jgi:segregation and condensation protein A